MLTFLCYPKCTTCRKAQKWLDDHGIAYTLRDIKQDKPTPEELAAWYPASGLPLRRFFNTSGRLYQSMELKSRLPAMEETIHLLQTLPEPPTIMVGGAVVTPEYARRMGADYYSKDARQSVEIAREVLG